MKIRILNYKKRHLQWRHFIENKIMKLYTYFARPIKDIYWKNNLFYRNFCRKEIYISRLCRLPANVFIPEATLTRNKSVDILIFYRLSLPEDEKKSVGQLCLQSADGFATPKTKLCIFHGGSKWGGSIVQENRSRDDHGESIRMRYTGVLATFVNHRTCNFKVVRSLTRFSSHLPTLEERDHFYY